MTTLLSRLIAKENAVIKADFAIFTRGMTMRHGWGIDGPGPARFGWYSVGPCGERYQGRTRADVVARFMVAVAS